MIAPVINCCFPHFCDLDFFGYLLIMESVYLSFDDLLITFTVSAFFPPTPRPKRTWWIWIFSSDMLSFSLSCHFYTIPAGKPPTRHLWYVSTHRLNFSHLVVNSWPPDPYNLLLYPPTDFIEWVHLETPWSFPDFFQVPLDFASYFLFLPLRPTLYPTDFFGLSLCLSFLIFSFSTLSYQADFSIKPCFVLILTPAPFF